MAVRCSMVFLAGACFLWKYAFFFARDYVAVITIAGPFRSADFLQEVVRDGLVIDDDDRRDVTVHWEIFVHFLTTESPFLASFSCMM